MVRMKKQSPGGWEVGGGGHHAVRAGQDEGGSNEKSRGERLEKQLEARSLGASCDRGRAVGSSLRLEAPGATGQHHPENRATLPLLAFFSPEYLRPELLVL